MSERIDDGDFESKPAIIDQERKAVALAEKPFRPFGETMQARKQRRRCLRRAERFNARAARGKRVEWNVDPVEIAVIVLAVLQMIDDLQRRAQCVIGRPDRAALAVHVADETTHRHRRQRTITDEIVPIAITQFGHVEPERGEQILRMARRKASRSKCVAQLDRDRIFVVAADKASLETIEQAKLLVRRKCSVIGDIVSGADKIIECQDHLAMARMNEE